MILDVEQWLTMAAPRSKWRARARRAMHPIVASGMTDGMSKQEIMTTVDKAYPFGERKYAPYKAWLEERQLLIAAFAVRPSQQERDACEVASDLVSEGRTEDALSLMEREAPNALNLRCPACNVRPGHACIRLSDFPGSRLVVPHRARLGGPAEQPRTTGPLFGDEVP